MCKVHAEIEYVDKERENISIHSDICPPKCDFRNMTVEHRKFLHDCLDEWLDKSNGTGCFYIKNAKWLIESMN